MIGVARETGEPLNELAHIEQSIADILTTPIGSRVMRRAYGSNLPDLIDKPFNATTKLLMAAETATAIKNR
jgi:phage baseplate assembly protein W